MGTLIAALLAVWIVFPQASEVSSESKAQKWFVKILYASRRA